MVWDLRGALLRKEERESSRLGDFEFKLRARSFRLLAEALALSSADLVPKIALQDDAALLDELARLLPHRAAELDDLFRRCRSEARSRLIAEEGDPAPHRLA